MPTWPWDKVRLDETPVRRRTDVSSGPEASPGTPPVEARNAGGRFGFLKLSDATIQKYARRFGRMLGLATASPVDAYVSDIIPSVTLNAFDPETYFPDDSLYWGSLGIEALAGNVSVVELSMPANAQKIAIIESLTLTRLNTLGDIVIGIPPAAGPLVIAGLAAGAQRPVQRDSRLAGTWESGIVRPALIPSSGQIAAPIALQGVAGVYYSGPRTNSAYLTFPIVLGPGNGIVFFPISSVAPVTATLAEGINVSFTLREIPLPEST